MIAISLIFTAIGCGRPQSPADSIALGRAAHACNNGGTWDGLECAKQHEQPEPDEPTAADHPKSPTTRKRNGPALQPTYEQPCDCEPSDPLCTCE